MSSDDDRNLLHAWTQRRDEAAFRRLVERYAGLVHGAALRRAGDAELAAEAAQDTFIRLATHAASIRRAESLPAWLHAAAVRAAADRVRSESRHRERMKRYRQNTDDSGGSEEAWRDALPLLDEAIARLNDTDRGLVLARYCQGESVSAAAHRLGLSTAAAQKRGERALEKLAVLLRSRGVVLSAAVLAGGLTPRLSHATPAGAASQWSATAMANASISPLPAAGITFMNAKALSAAAAVAALCVPVGLKIHARSAVPPASVMTPAPESRSLNRSAAPAPRTAAEQRRIVNGVDLAALAREIAAFPPRTGRLRRELELRSVMLALDAEQCAVVAEWLRTARDGKALIKVTEYLFRRWAMLDREAALAVAREFRPEFPRQFQMAVFRQWAAQDAAGLFARFSSHLGKEKGDFAMEACRVALSSLARSDPRAAIALAEQADTAPAYKLTEQVLMGWSEGASPQPVLQWLAAVSDDTKRRNWYDAFIGFLSDRQPQAAWESLVTWPDRKAADDHACSTLNLWAGHDPAAAVAAWLAGPAQWRNRHFAYNLASVLHYASPAVADKLAAELPDPQLRACFAEHLQNARAAAARR